MLQKHVLNFFSPTVEEVFPGGLMCWLTPCFVDAQAPDVSQGERHQWRMAVQRGLHGQRPSLQVPQTHQQLLQIHHLLCRGRSRQVCVPVCMCPCESM